MCRTSFLVLGSQEGQVLTLFVDLPARVVKGDNVALWPLLPVEQAALPVNAWLQDEDTFEVLSTCWTRDEDGVYLAAMLFNQKQEKGDRGEKRCGEIMQNKAP